MLVSKVIILEVLESVSHKFPLGNKGDLQAPDVGTIVTDTVDGTPLRLNQGKQVVKDLKTPACVYQIVSQINTIWCTE